MTVISANELKTKGISNIEKLLKEESEVIISVHGKPRYVLIDLAQYETLRESELAAAWFQVREDLAEGRYRRESADEHIARVEAELANEL